MTELIQNEQNPNRFFTMMLNMAEDDLDPFQYRLLAHYVRWSNANPTGYKTGVRKTAALVKMDTATVKRARDELAEMGYIDVIETATKNGRKTIIVRNRMAENIERYTPSEEPKSVGNIPHFSDPIPMGVRNIRHVKESIPSIPSIPKNTDSQYSGDAALSAANQTPSVLASQSEPMTQPALMPPPLLESKPVQGAAEPPKAKRQPSEKQAARNRENALLAEHLANAIGRPITGGDVKKEYVMQARKLIKNGLPEDQFPLFGMWLLAKDWGRSITVHRLFSKIPDFQVALKTTKKKPSGSGLTDAAWYAKQWGGM